MFPSYLTVMVMLEDMMETLLDSFSNPYDCDLFSSDYENIISLQSKIIDKVSTLTSRISCFRYFFYFWSIGDKHQIIKDCLLNFSR